MNEPQVLKIPAASELDAEATEAAAGGNSCDPAVIVTFSQSLVEVYDNLVDFASHVIERVAGSNS